MKLKKDSIYLLPLGVSFLVTNFLFFIDEGFYDFRWMKDPGNWFVFGIYLLVIYAFVLVVLLVTARIGRWARQLISSPR